MRLATWGGPVLPGKRDTMKQGMSQDRMRGRVVIDLRDIPFVTTEERVREAMIDGLREFSTMVAAAADVRVKLVRVDADGEPANDGAADGATSEPPNV